LATQKLTFQPIKANFV